MQTALGCLSAAALALALTTVVTPPGLQWQWELRKRARPCKGPLDRLLALAFRFSQLATVSTGRLSAAAKLTDIGWATDTRSRAGSTGGPVPSGTKTQIIGTQ